MAPGQVRGSRLLLRQLPCSPLALEEDLGQTSNLTTTVKLLAFSRMVMSFRSCSAPEELDDPEEVLTPSYQKANKKQLRPPFSLITPKKNSLRGKACSKDEDPFRKTEFYTLRQKIILTFFFSNLKSTDFSKNEKGEKVF